MVDHGLREESSTPAMIRLSVAELQVAYASVCQCVSGAEEK